MQLLVFLIVVPGLIIFIDFLGFLFKGKQIVGQILLAIAELGSLLILPFMYGSFGKQNVCCADELDTAAFSLQHQLTIIALIVLSLAAYFYSKFRKQLASPIVEVVINTSIFIGIILNIFIFFHTSEIFYAIFGSLPVILLGILMLARNQKLFLKYSASRDRIGKIHVIAWSILSARPLVKFPVLLVLSLPLFVVISAILLLFGQQPDSIVRAFTDTYKHNFSQWDYKCDNVQCGGHYLCSVAAMGHRSIVRPQRYGVRNNGHIICNRQLLISNAFEEFIQEMVPGIHGFMRRRYNKVGDIVHRYYGIFSIKLVSDIIYFLMKPLEWIFLFTLYTCDRQPENRIAKQYLSTRERLELECMDDKLTTKPV